MAAVKTIGFDDIGIERYFSGIAAFNAKRWFHTIDKVYSVK